MGQQKLKIKFYNKGSMNGSGRVWVQPNCVRSKSSTSQKHIGLKTGCYSYYTNLILTYLFFLPNR